MKENYPTISLIIPAHNEEKYIGTCLDFVHQNASDIFSEILVIDNASTDATSAIAKQHAAVRVVQESQKGLTRARQRGFQESTGDILVYIDADTRIPEHWHKTLIAEFAPGSPTVLLSGPYHFHDSSLLQKVLVKLYWHGLGFPTYKLLGYMAIGGNFAIRRETLVAMNGFDTSIEFYGEDTNIARRANRFGKVIFTSKFSIYTSARRLHHQGWIKTGIIYIQNFLSEVVRHRPATQEYKDIR